MKKIFRNAQPTARDYLGLALVVSVFLLLGALVLLPQGSLLIQGSPLR